MYSVSLRSGIVISIFLAMCITYDMCSIRILDFGISTEKLYENHIFHNT